MKTILEILGILFLVLTSILISLFAIMCLNLYRWQKKLALRAADRENQEGFITSKSLDIFTPLYHGLPIIGKWLGKQFDSMKSGVDYFNDSIPLILSDWKSQELVKRSTLQFLESLASGEPKNSFEHHHCHLGKLTSYRGIKSVENNEYVAEASFEKGLAQIGVRLVQQDDKWAIDNFRVDYLFQLDSQVIDV